MNITSTSPPPEPNQGFTLLELSIVLVIIGLIIGGVLVGQDLIKASEIRATMTQYEKYNSGVNTFRTKYNGIPGDLRRDEANAFGLYALAAASILGYGDGNGLVEGGNTAATVPRAETILFWRHMSDAGLVDGAHGITGGSVIATATGLVSGAVGDVRESIPLTRLSPQNGIIVFSANGLNYFSMVPVIGLTTAPAYTFGTSGIPPIVAYNIDTKIDDGAPNAGTIIARGLTAVNVAPTVSATSQINICTLGAGTATDTYNRVAASGGNDPSCALRLRFQ